MEPFTPDDPLWKLMGKARPVVQRPNFTQNVMRAVRQEAQEKSWQVRLSVWLAAWRRPLLGGIAATAVLVLMGITQWQNAGRDSAEVAAVVVNPPMVPDAEMAALADSDMSAPLDSLNHMDSLVAMEDTSTLTDTEIQFLLY